jgi:uncharacterized protein (TIGR00297 family)
MQEEMRREEWRKAIPQERDRWQSRALVGVVGLLLVALTADAVRRAATLGIRFPAFVLETFALSAAFAFVVRRLRAATAGGAACGGMICLLLTFWTGIWTASVVRSALAPLVLLFLLTFLATRTGRQRKAMAGLAEERRGRNAAQVIANLSIAAICVSPWTAWIVGRETSQMLTGGAISIMKTMALAALVEATADTVSSEIGQAFGGRTVMITTMRRVEAGTDGAVTLLGSCAGIAGGAAVTLAGAWAMHLHAAAAMVSLVAGICGLFFDSLVGATLERRGWIGNDLVNFASTAFAAAVAAAGCWTMGR